MHKQSVLRTLFFVIAVFGVIVSAKLVNTYQGLKKTKAAEANISRTDPSGGTKGKQLFLNGQPYKFVGVNAYSLATLWSNNSGCGDQVDDIDGLMKSLPPQSLIRFWAWQGSMAINPNTKALDWTGIDRVFRSAEANNQKLIVSLGSQHGTCDDGHWKDKAWYDGGYKELINKGKYPIVYSYLDYIRLAIERYKDSSALGMWEYLNEPEVSECKSPYTGEACISYLSCPDNTAASNSLRSFFDNVGTEILRIDPNHLLETGILGNGQCGHQGTAYQYVHDSPYVDVASYHDYSNASVTMPGDQWNGLALRISQMNTINKPLIIGEAGIEASDTVSSCMKNLQRKDAMKAKMDSMFTAGVVGFLPWDWVPSLSGECDHDFGASDPLMNLLRTYQIPGIPASTSTPTPTPTPTVRPTSTPTSNWMIVYSDGLSGTWKNWSWGGIVDLNSSAYVYSGTRSIKWTPKSYSGLKLHTDNGFNASSTTVLNFTMRGSATGQKFTLTVSNGSTGYLQVPFTKIGGNPPVGIWKTYSVPASTLSAVGKPIKEVIIQEAAGIAQSAVFVDEIYFSN